MARNRSKYSRARVRAKVRRPKRRGGARWYYGVLAVIVTAGFAGIVASVGGPAEVHPLVFNGDTGEGDHWHSAFDVNICGEWLPNATEFTTRKDNPGVYAGLHTHDDGFIHVEAATPAEAGNHATLGRFLEYAGLAVSERSIDLGLDAQALQGLSVDPAKRTWTNGDECPPGSEYAGRKGVFKWSLDCAPRTDDPNQYKLEDGAVVALAFIPEGEDVGVPPNATAAPVGEGGEPLENLDVKACSTVVPGGTTTSTSSGTNTTTTSVSTTP